MNALEQNEMDTVSVVFQVPHAQSHEHAKVVVRNYLNAKGITERGDEELTPGYDAALNREYPRHEYHYGYKEIL